MVNKTGRMRRVKAGVILLLLLFVCIAGASHTPVIKVCGRDLSALGGEKGWKLVKDKNGIKVFLRKTSLSPIKVFRGVMEVETEMNRLVGVLWDGENYTKWLVLCNEAKFLKIYSETEQILYTMNKPPWPVSKRDSICHRRIYQDPATKSVYVEMCGIPNFVPERKGRIRVPLLTGYGKLTPLGDGKVELVYEVLVDPSGMIPDWVVNFTVVNTPFSTLQNLQRMLPLEEYKDFDMSFIPEAKQRVMK